MRTDGSERTMIISDNADADILQGFIVEEDWIYFTKTDNYNTYSLYKIRTDGTEQVKLGKNLGSFFYVADGWVYYTDKSDDGLYRMRTDGMDIQVCITDSM
jgi:hypothetical protein